MSRRIGNVVIGMCAMLVLVALVWPVRAQAPQPAKERTLAQCEVERRALDMYVASMREQRHRDELDKFGTYSSAENELKAVRAENAALRKSLKAHEDRAAAQPPATPSPAPPSPAPESLGQP